MTTPVSASAPKTSLWEDFVDIFYAPSQVFARRRDGRFGAALLVLTVVSALLFFFVLRGPFESVFDAQFDAGMRAREGQGPALSPEQMASARRFARGIGLGIGLLNAPLVVLAVGAVLWLVGKLFGSAATFAQSMMVATYANVPRLLGTVVAGALAYFADPVTLTSPARLTLSPARFMPEGTPPALLFLLMRFDVMTIWATVLLGIGLSVVGNLPRSRAMMAAGAVWLVATLVQVAQGAQQPGG